MKKYISLAFMVIALSLGFTSCSVETNEEPGGTNVQKMAGRWDVTVNAVDESGNVLYEDPYGLGTFTIFTLCHRLSERGAGSDVSFPFLCVRPT